MAGRLVLLATTHRVAAGLLAWPAWEALHAATVVTVADLGHPLVPHVEAAGRPVSEVRAQSPSNLAAALLDLATGAVVVHLLASDGDDALTAALAEELGTRAYAGTAPELEALAGSWDVPGARLLDLVAVMDRLRSPGGCPWDAEQTHESLLPYLLEETYETVESIETGDLVGLQEELGDLLLQVAFHARIGEEHAEKPWSIDDVAAGIVDKLVSRHPHVFADVDAPTAAHVEANWEALKKAEKRRESAVDGVPLAQPALSLAAKLLSRAERAGVAVHVPTLGEAGASVGDLLFAIVADARRRGLDAEAELRAAARRYAEHVRAAERIAGPPADAAAAREA